MNDANSGLADIVRDVYIKPIRSLLAIDDEFPTMDEMLDATLVEEALKKKGTDSLREIIKFARDRDVPWLVDVHDGRDISGTQEKRIAPRLHASDLMVLDYKLKGEELGGSTAIDILRGLATNDHFNLVLLYTKGEGGKVVDVLYEIALGLCCKCDAYKLTAVEASSAVTALEAWDAVQNSVAGQLLAEFTSQLFLKTFERRSAKLKWLLDTDGGVQLKDFLAAKPRDLGISQDLVLRWLFEKRQEQISSQLFGKDLGQIRIGVDEDCCWISCEKLFITLLSKKCAPKEFETKIVEAIVASHPTPHRLLLTKMRTSIEQRGLVAEVDILRDTHIQTAWLEDFLKPDPKDETSAIVGTVTRHWEAIGDALRDELIVFGTNLRSKYLGIEFVEVLKRSGIHGANPNSNETLERYNNFVSTKPFDRGHLTTGHIFSILQATPAEAEMPVGAATPDTVAATAQQSDEVEYWMCLSPACDMVPGQKKKDGRSDTTGKSVNFLTFAAVRLHTITSEIAVGKATENLCVFLKIGDSIRAFSILKDADAKGSPLWERMIAKDFGIFNSETKLLPLSRVTTFDGQVKVQEVEAKVFAQLRSDYATNLLQKFGTQLTRPGLGMQFKSRR